MSCETVTLDGVTAIICSRGRGSKQACRWCSAKATLLCDHPTGRTRTCSAPMCAAHATEEPGVGDLCPQHKPAVVYPEPDPRFRCWKCWRAPCECPQGQGLRGPIPPEMRADPSAAPTEAREVRDPEAVLPGSFDGRWGAPAVGRPAKQPRKTTRRRGAP